MITCRSFTFLSSNHRRRKPLLCVGTDGREGGTLKRGSTALYRASCTGLSLKRTMCSRLGGSSWRSSSGPHRCTMWLSKSWRTLICEYISLLCFEVAPFWLPARFPTATRSHQLPTFLRNLAFSTELLVFRSRFKIR